MTSKHLYLRTLFWIKCDSNFLCKCDPCFYPSYSSTSRKLQSHSRSARSIKVDIDSERAHLFNGYAFNLLECGSSGHRIFGNIEITVVPWEQRYSEDLI